MRTSNHGFTLIETVLFIVIVGIAISAVALQVSVNVQHSADPLLRQKGIAILQKYLNQMQAVRWDETTPLGGGSATAQSAPGLDAGETCVLTQLDDFDDFDCFNNANLGEGFSIDINVTNGTAAWGSVPAAEHKMAVITVANPIAESLSATVYRANY